LIIFLNILKTKVSLSPLDKSVKILRKVVIRMIEQPGLRLLTSVEDVTHGQGFVDLVKAFEDISRKRPEGCMKLAVFMRDKFNVEVEASVVPSASEYKF
jgi:hypothetical protein